MSTSTTSKPRHVFTGVPAFFRACCAEAAIGRVYSSRGWIRYGYKDAGYQLACHTGGEIPYTADLDEWETQVQELFDALEAGDRAAIWRWYALTFPRCMALIPRQRRWAFIDGVIEASEEGKIEL